MEEYKPQLVIVEGIRSNMGKSPSALIEDIQNCRKKEFSTCGEPLYAAHLAFESKIPFMGGESSPKDELKALQGRGYLLEDAVSFYIIRQIPQWKREKQIDDMEVRAEKMIAWLFDKFEIPNPGIHFSDVLKWYKVKMQKTLDVKTLTSEDTRPNPSGDAPILERIANILSKVRNEVILTTLTHGLNEYDRVLVIYGAGHKAELERAIQAMLPYVSDEKPF